MVALAVAWILALISASNAIPNGTLNLYDRNGPTTSGTYFMVGFLPNLRVSRSISGPVRQLLVTTDEPEPVNFTVHLNENLPAEMRVGFPLTATVAYGEVRTINLHENIAPTSALERSKAVRIVTEGGKKVSVRGFSDETRTSDGFTAISCDGMATRLFNRYEYVALSAEQNTESSQPRKSAILIVPCEDNTVVKIEPSQVLTLTGLGDLPLPPPARIRQSSSGELRANAGQTILLAHTDDLSGTVLRASRPIAVFSGHECGNIPKGYSTCDYLVEQFPPGLTFGHTFFLVPYAGRASGDMIRVGTLTDGTQVTVTCVTSSSGDSPSLLEPLAGDSLIDRGEYLTYMTPGNSANSPDYRLSYCCLNASQPVVVAQYGTSYTTDSGLRGKSIIAAAGDPFMSIVPPVSHYANNFTMSSVSGAGGSFPDRYISIAIAAEFFDNSTEAREQIKINGATASPIDGYVPLYCSPNEICGYGAQIRVAGGILNVYHEVPNYGIMVSYYAYQHQNSYGFMSGYELTPISATRAILEDITVPEGIGTVTISVPRLGDLNQRSKATMTYRLLGPGEATVGEDFADFDPVLLDYRGGNKRIEVLEFQITIRDDNFPEPPESFRIYGENIQNLMFPFPFLTVTITDDDEAGGTVVYFNRREYSVSEDGGSVTLTVRTNVPGGPPNGSVTFFTEDGSANAPDDYISVSRAEAFPVNFGSGSFETTVTVLTRDDRLFEANETFFGRLQSTGLANVSIIRDTAEITIVNDDAQSGVVSIQALTYEVQESAEYVSVVVVKTGNLQVPIHGNLTTLAGSASDSTDFSGRRYAFTIQPSEQQISVRVAILNDGIVELLREEFSLSLSVQSLPGLHLGNSQTSVSIIDDDGVAISLVPSAQTVAEGSDAVFRAIAMGDSDLPYSVVFQSVDGTAHAPADYRPANLTLTRDQLQGDGYQVTIPVLDDSVVEERESFQGRLLLTQQSLDLGVIRLAQSQGEVAISDNDVADIGFISSVYSVDEGAGSAILFIQNRNPNMEREVVVEFTTTGETATDGEDYIGKTESVTFQPGQSLSSVQVMLIDDAVYEGLQEFSLVLSSTESAVNIFQADSTAQITDDDEIIIRFNPTSLAVLESGSVEVVIQRIGASEEPVTITLSTQTGTADSSDFVEIVNLPVIFEVSEREKRVTIQTQEDSLVEGTEDFTALLEPVSERIVITENTTHISIEEITNVVVEFQPNSYIVNEKEEIVRFILVKRTPTTHNVTVQLSTVDGSAKSVLDFSPSRNKAVTFRPSEVTKIVMVPIRRDDVFEGEEMFMARLSVAPDSDGVVIGQQDTATTAIIDDISISFTSTEYTAAEDGGPVEVCLTTSAVLAEPATVVLLALESLPVDAKEGEDFRGGEYSVEIPAGTTEHCTEIIITDDSVGLEGDELFSVSFDVSQLPDGMELGPVNSSSIRITDDDIVRVIFDEETYGVTEGSGSVSVCVRREGEAAESFSIDVATSDDDPVQAQAGSDYQAVQVSLTFAPGDERQCFQVPVLVDQLDEGKEDFRAEITTVPDGVIMPNQNRSTTISILDSHGAKLVNDTVIADPLFTAPVESGDAHFCYEIHGKPNTIFNLVSDKCTVVNAEYAPMRVPQHGNVIGAVGIRAADSVGNCHNIEVRMSPAGSGSGLVVSVDGSEVSGVARVDSVQVRRYRNRVRVSVPNCELVDLVMWVMLVEMGGQDMVKFVIMRGANLTPTSHGLVGQFWNVPVSMTLYDGPLRPGYESFFDREDLYLITVTPVSGITRTFLGELYHMTWDRRSGPCYYAGDSQGGRTAEREQNESVIEGHYTDYVVDDLLDDHFVYSQFERDRCTETT